ncbi:MAG: hypothetical protein ACJAR9_000922 [Celeribacter sp.]|jgi:hypothetical protein
MEQVNGLDAILSRFAQIIGYTLPVIVTQKAITIGVISGKRLGELGQKVVLLNAGDLHVGGLGCDLSRLFLWDRGVV